MLCIFQGYKQTYLLSRDRYYIFQSCSLSKHPWKDILEQKTVSVLATYVEMQKVIGMIVSQTTLVKVITDILMIILMDIFVYLPN